MKTLFQLYRIQWRWSALRWHLSLPFKQVLSGTVLLLLAALYPFYFIYTFLLEPLKVCLVHKEEAKKIIASWDRNNQEKERV